MQAPPVTGKIAALSGDYTNPDATGHERIIIYDVIRAVAIVTVILVHTFMSARNITIAKGPLHDRVVQDFLNVADVILFLFIFSSGALVWGPKWEPGVHEFRRFVLSRFSRVVVPYLIWSGLFITLLFLGAPGSQAPFSADYIADLGTVDFASFFILVKRAFIYVVTGSSWFHLYFTPVVVTFYLFTPALSRLLRARKYSADIVLLISIVIGIVGASIFPLPQAGDPSYFFHSYAHRFSFFLPAMAAGGWFQFRFGGWAQQISERTDKPGIWQHARNLVITMSNLSFGTYYVHALFILIIQLVLSVLALNTLWLNFAFIGIVFVVVTVGSYSFTYVLSKWHVTKWLT